MGAQNFLPDWTIVIQLGLFFVCYFFLKKFFFGPYLQLIELRRAKTSGLKEKAQASLIRAEKLKTDYEALMKAERRKSSAWLDEEKKKISDHERQQISQVRGSVGDELKKLRETLHQEVERARRELSSTVAEYSSLIASKILGKNIRVTPSVPDSAQHSTAETTV